VSRSINQNTLVWVCDESRRQIYFFKIRYASVHEIKHNIYKCFQLITQVQ